MPPRTGTVDDIDLDLLGPADPDDRRPHIEADHPVLQRALQDGRDEIMLDRRVVNPNLHIALHEIVAERLWADDPPETCSTAQRLSELGYDRHEVLHMLLSVVSDEASPRRSPTLHRRTPAGPVPRWQTSGALGGAARDAAHEQG